MRNKKFNSMISAMIVGIFLFSAIIPISQSAGTSKLDGFSKGPSYTNVKPIRKSTMVNFEKDSYLDDYAYLASLSSSVFLEDDILYSHPLLYYQDSYPVKEDKEKTLDTRKGIDFFMEDWMGYCNQKQDQMTLINIPRNKLDSSWKANEYVFINGDDPYEISQKIALQDWSYSDDVVIAPAEEKPEREIVRYESNLEGKIPAGYNVEHQIVEMKEPDVGIGGNYEPFDVSAPAKYIVANLEWENVLYDYDFQIYDSELGMAAANSKWNVLYDEPGAANEPVGSYIYNYGEWLAGVTYMPTQSSQGISELNLNQLLDIFKGSGKGLMDMVMRKLSGVMLPIDVYLYPGVEEEIKEKIPYGCRDIEFKLKWDNDNVRLGFFILDTSGTETFSNPNADTIINGIEKGKTERNLTLKLMGETDENSNYKICVFSLDDANSDIDFEVEYSWQQNITRKEGDILASASEGAILASQLNCPLLYVKSNSLPNNIKDTIYKLGVKNIHYVNLNNCANEKVKNSLKEITNVKEYSDYIKIYDEIRENSGSNDVIFSTVDPYSYYYGGELKPAGENPGSLFIGPAAYIAAHHGAPLLIVDNHPELSQATSWHTIFWRKTAGIPVREILPTVSCMVLTGRRTIKFLEDWGYDLPLDKENLVSMITIAGQYDIGFPWDRTFTGRLIPGRFCSSPVDIAYHISRNIFYPALIFENPAVSGPIKLINGSKSVSRPYIGKLIYPKGTDLVITRDSKEEQYNYPILHTYNVYQYKFNEIAEKAWGAKYVTFTGKTPGETPSNDPIDIGVVEGVTSARFPDIHESEVAPIYASKAGYENVFSTGFEPSINNLNEGVIMWMESCHGNSGDSGSIDMWNPESPYVDEPNPWRAYDRIFLGMRNWDEFRQLLTTKYGVNPTLTKLMGIVTKPIDLLTVDVASTEDPDREASNPDLAKIPGVGGILFDAFGVVRIKDNIFTRLISLIPFPNNPYRLTGDGTVIDCSQAGTDVMERYLAYDFDDELDNLHCMGLNSCSCLTAGTFFQQTFMRHGCSYLIVDPWTTSWYSSLWFQSIPRQLALGKTIGQTFEYGMEMVGAEYLIDHWWWDLNENVLFYGDPDLRVYTPSQEYSDENFWTYEEVKALEYDENKNIDGHMPYGATSYPHKTEPKPIMPIWLILIIAIIVVLVLALIVMKPKKK